MSEQTKEQTVVDGADDQAKPDSEVVDAQGEQDDLENLLKQYDAADQDEQRPPADAKPEPKKADPGESESGQPAVNDGAAAEILKKLAQYDQERKEEKRVAEDREFRQDMDKAISAVRGELPDDLFDDDLVESWIQKRAYNDQRLNTAWKNRKADPKHFQRVIGALGREFAKRYSALPDKQATEDREAVTQAVRGASNKAPEAKETNYASMSNNEFADQVEKEFGFRPMV